MAGQTVADRYELEQLVGAGGMSSVYRAHDRVLERTVALKVLHERLAAQSDFVDRFSREARLVAGLSHHNIVAVIDRGDHDGSPFIVFEYIPGENLKQMLGRTGPVPVERVLELGIEIAQGLEFAHEKGFVHRDVKPQNVLLNGKGEAKVTDFGIARTLEAAESGATQTGTVLGTCDYISPEQAQGRRVDAQSDVYSLGVVLYELLTGEVPFTGENFVAVAMQHINQVPPPVTLKRPEVPRRVELAVEKALSKNPAARFATMSDLRLELEACLRELRSEPDASATGILPVVRPPRSEHTKSRRRGALAAAALILLALIAGGIVYAVTRHGGATGSPGTGGGGSSAPIDLTAAAAYDPFGDHVENSGSIGNATDSNVSTYWETEHYDNPNFGNLKSGVGLVLDAAAPVKAGTITIRSSTPGYKAIIRAGPSVAGPFTADSSSQQGTDSTTFTLDGNEARYYLIWITYLGPSDQVRIEEVTAT